MTRPGAAKYADSEFVVLMDGTGSARFSRRTNCGTIEMSTATLSVQLSYRLTKQPNVVPRDGRRSQE